MLVFLQQLAWSIADMGKKVSVICPVPVNINREYRKFPEHTVEKTDRGNTLDVYFPKTIGFGQSHYIFGKSPVPITTYFLEKAARNVLKSFEEKPDVLYGHFLAPSGIAVARLGREFGIPAFFAYGESHDTISQFGEKKSRKELKSISGVIAVSSFLKRQIVDRGIVPMEKVEVFPNAIRSDRFYQRDKLEARAKFGLPLDEVLVGFVGGYNERKGILRVSEAMENVVGAKLICAGAGELSPYGTNCIFSQELKPEDVPWFNSAADIFVLPTLLEGCSNAVVEAMACGLPVVSSNLEFNDDILDNQCAIRIDPMSIKEIETAINKLVADEDMRKKMSIAALKKAESLTLDARANKIVDFIEKRIQG